jgi:hypothetical protein
MAKTFYNSLPEEAQHDYLHLCAELNARFQTSSAGPKLWDRIVELKMGEDEDIEAYFQRGRDLRAQYENNPSGEIAPDWFYKKTLHRGLTSRFKERLDNKYPDLVGNKTIDTNTFCRLAAEQYEFFIDTQRQRRAEQEERKKNRPPRPQGMQNMQRPPTFNNGGSQFTIGPTRQPNPQFRGNFQRGRGTFRPGGGQFRQPQQSFVPPHNSGGMVSHQPAEVPVPPPRVMQVEEGKLCEFCKGKPGFHHDQCKIRVERRKFFNPRGNWNRNQGQQRPNSDQQRQDNILGPSWHANPAYYVCNAAQALSEEWPRIKLREDQYDLSNTHINPQGDTKPIDYFTLQPALNALDEKWKAVTEKKHLEKRKLNAMTFTNARDINTCTVTLNIAGIQVMDILLDTGAQPNVITLATLIRLGSLTTGGGIREAMKGMIRDLPTGTHIKGIGASKMNVVGKIELPVILSKTKTVHVPFLVTLDWRDSIMIGTPGLRQLGFTLTSSLIGKRDFLDPKYKPVDTTVAETAEDPPQEKAHINTPDELLQRDQQIFNSDVQNSPTKQPKKRGRKPTPKVTIQLPTQDQIKDSKDTQEGETSPEIKAPDPNVVVGKLQRKMLSDKEILKSNKHIDIDEDTGNFIAAKPPSAKATTLERSQSLPEIAKLALNSDTEEDPLEQYFCMEGTVEADHPF